MPSLLTSGFGLIIHETKVSGSNVEALVTLVDLEHLRAGVTGRRLHRTRAALRVAARRNKLSGRVIEVLVRHATFCGLARRVSLSVFDTVYKFIQAAGTSECRSGTACGVRGGPAPGS